MTSISIMSMVGSAVPQALRAEGHLACWYLVVDGVVRTGPFTSFEAAAASKMLWTFEAFLRSKPAPALAA